jgi:hypothetical protein
MPNTWLLNSSIWNVIFSSSLLAQKLNYFCFNTFHNTKLSFAEKMHKGTKEVQKRWDPLEQFFFRKQRKEEEKELKKLVSDQSLKNFFQTECACTIYEDVYRCAHLSKTSFSLSFSLSLFLSSSHSLTLSFLSPSLSVFLQDRKVKFKMRLQIKKGY